MKLILIPAFLLLFLASCIINSQSNSEKYGISAGELEKWVNFLASDDMKGRRNGSPEMEEAAEWIALKFNEFDINPVYLGEKCCRCGKPIKDHGWLIRWRLPKPSTNPKITYLFLLAESNGLVCPGQWIVGTAFHVIKMSDGEFQRKYEETTGE